MLPLYLSEDDEYPDSRDISSKTSAASELHRDELDYYVYNVCDIICDTYGKYQKRQREKKAQFAWVCEPGKRQPGQIQPGQRQPRKIGKAVRAAQIVGKRQCQAKRVALSKTKLRRPSKYVLENE
jgi:hypothetical protein